MKRMCPKVEQRGKNKSKVWSRLWLEYGRRVETMAEIPRACVSVCVCERVL